METFKVKNKDIDFLSNRELPEVLRKLDNVKGLTGQNLLNVSKLIGSIDNQARELMKVRSKLISEYAQLDDNENPKVDKDGQLIFIDDQAKDTFLNAWTEILDESVEIHGKRLSDQVIKKMEPTPKEYRVLGFLLAS